MNSIPGGQRRHALSPSHCDGAPSCHPPPPLSPPLPLPNAPPNSTALGHTTPWPHPLCRRGPRAVLRPPSGPSAPQSACVPFPPWPQCTRPVPPPGPSARGPYPPRPQCTRPVPPPAPVHAARTPPGPSARGPYPPRPQCTRPVPPPAPVHAARTPPGPSARGPYPPRPQCTRPVPERSCTTRWSTLSRFFSKRFNLYNTLLQKYLRNGQCASGPGAQSTAAPEKGREATTVQTPHTKNASHRSSRRYPRVFGRANAQRTVECQCFARRERRGCPWGRGGGEKSLRIANGNERSRDALCFMAKTWATHKTTEAEVNSGWRLAAVGGWRLVVLGGCP